MQKYIITYKDKSTGKQKKSIVTGNAARLKKVQSLKNAGHKNIASREYM